MQLTVLCVVCIVDLASVCLLFCQICGVAVLAFGVIMMVSSNYAALTPSLASFNIANILLITGIIITCVSFLGFLGALKENRCLLLSVTHTQILKAEYRLCGFLLPLITSYF